jgi:ribonuclease HII
VVAAAVILPADAQSLAGVIGEGVDETPVRDSKLLSPAQREVAAEAIRSVAVAVGVGVVPAEVVDGCGIAFAGQLAFWRAARDLTVEPDYLLVDGFPLWSPRYPQLAVLQGDRRCLSIAAASVIAKVTRDGIMRELGTAYPQYGFGQNAGYGTRRHREGLAEVGPCPYHRRSYAPVAAICGRDLVVEAQPAEELDDGGA